MHERFESCTTKITQYSLRKRRGADKTGSAFGRGERKQAVHFFEFVISSVEKVKKVVL